MCFPPHFIFQYPGFPSILVSYLKTNDFFYSGHTGIPIICGLELFRSYKNYWFLGICILISSFEVFTMVVTRSHYTIDIIAGISFAHFLFKVTELYVDKIDTSKIGMKYVD